MAHEYIKESDTFNTSRNGTVPKPTAADVSAGKVLGAGGNWVAGSGGGGGSSTLAGLDDVDTTGVSDGDLLSYDSNANKWVPQTPSNGHNYSTSEQVVGTWIDGKPIYEKTVHFTKTDCTKENDYDYRLDFNRTALGIKDVIDIKGILKMVITNWGTIEIKFNGRAYCLNDNTKDRWVDWTNYYQSSAIKSQKASEGYGFNLTSETSNWDGYYTIQYTKTTD